MRRESLIPRPDWPQKMESLGFHYHSIDGIYWDERACYALTAREVDMLEAATNTLHAMCIEAAQSVIDNDLFGRFAIPAEFVPMVVESWERDDWTLFGRFDLSWDGRSPPKLLEYNADTPTALLEASVAQWYWLQDVKPDRDQFNSLHEKLIAQWQRLREDSGNVIHFTGVADSDEDVGNIEYLRDTALQAGLDARFIDITSIGWDAVNKRFVDADMGPVDALFKLYPWEWLVREPFGLNLINQRDMMLLEPAWKMLLSNKAILPVLWEKFPNHPNLLPAYFEPHQLANDFVKKPLLSREGANVSIASSSGDVVTGGEYGDEGYIYQAYHPLPSFPANGEPNYMVVGSWIVGDEAAGIGIREDESPITKNTSRFLPHYFE
jgi:glutathionylspermidine synthase